MQIQVQLVHRVTTCTNSNPLGLSAAAEVAPTQTTVVNTTSLMFAASNQVFFPELYDLEATNNQRALHEITNSIISEMKARPGELGGWSDPASAQEARGMLKDLASVLYHVVPHASSFRRLGHTLPEVLVRCAATIAAKRKDIPKEFSQELCIA